MSTRIEIELYHTCRDEKRESIPQLAPFKARDNGKQWLGVGYYFWVESQSLAKIWGASPAYSKQGYLVLKYQLGINQDDLLDLVGSPNDQESFKKLMNEFKKQLGTANAKITVAACVDWLQKRQVWEWLAVKLADYGKVDKLSSRAIPVAGGDVTFLQPRIQLCLYAKPIDTNTTLEYQGIVDSGKGKTSIFSEYKKR